jgi:hypothetical protein
MKLSRSMVTLAIGCAFLAKNSLAEEAEPSPSDPDLPSAGAESPPEPEDEPEPEPEPKPEPNAKPRPASEPPPCPTIEPGEPIGRVLRIEDGIVVLVKDPFGTLQLGDRVGFRDALGDERIIGKVVRVNNKTYYVRIQVNEEVRIGELAYRTPSEPTGHLVLPVSSDYRAQFDLDIKPWVGLNDSDSGALFEAGLRFRLSERLRLAAVLEPLVPPVGATPLSFEAYVAPSVSFKLAEMGFGVGAGTTNVNPWSDPEVGVLLTPILRVGHEDGLMLRARSSAVVYGGRALFASIRTDAAIPVAYGTRLLFGGGGGDSGYSYFEVGIELLLAGNGQRGSWFGRGLLGYGGAHAVETDPIYGTSTYIKASGPYLALGVSRRF